MKRRWIPALINRLPVSHGKISLDLKLRAFVGAASHPSIDAHCYFKQFMTEEARGHLSERDDAVGETVRLFRSAVHPMLTPTPYAPSFEVTFPSIYQTTFWSKQTV